MLPYDVPTSIIAYMAQHSRVLVENTYHNGHPDLIVNGIYPNDSVKSTEVYLGYVTIDDFRKNPRGDESLGPTA